MTTSEPALYAALRRRRFYRSLGVVLVAMAAFLAIHDLVDVEGWGLVEVLLAAVALVVGAATWRAQQREARVLATVRAARPNAWVRSAAVYRLPQHVVMAVEGDRIAVIGYDGVEVASWERHEMESVGVVSLPSHWPPRQAVVIHFSSPDVPTVLVTFTHRAGLTAPPEWANEAVRVLAPF